MKTKDWWDRKKKRPLKEEQQEWLVYFLGYHSQEELLRKYDDNHNPEYIQASYICYNKIRISTLRKYLVSLNLVLDNDDRWDDDLEPIKEEILKVLPDHAKEPVFDTTGTKKIKKEYSYDEYNEVPAESIYDKFITVDDLTPKQMIHVFLYNDSYSFKILKRKKYNSLEDMLCVYPNALLNETDQTIIRSRALDYAKRHLDQIISYAFNIRFRIIQTGHHNLNYSEAEKLTSTEGISKTLEKVERSMRLLRRARLELLVLEKIANQIGVEQYTERIMDLAVEYLTNQAPLWMNSEDKEELELSKIMLQNSTI